MSNGNYPIESAQAPFREDVFQGDAGQNDIFTIDVEDWFHILEVAGTPDLNSWDSLESRVEHNFKTLLDMLAACNVKATCFTLGWVAKRFPRMLREASGQGHDIASHGYAHQIVRGLTRATFRDDIRSAKAVIEDATGKPVLGYRAPGFSITHETPWAFAEIAEAGYLFDSSIFPASHGHGGVAQASRSPHIISTAAGRIVEFPISVVDTILGPRCFFGGGYLRIAPMGLIRSMAKRVRADGRGVVWYIHPREIDPDHPRLSMPLNRRFKSYVNLSSTAGKLREILRGGRFTTFSELAIRILNDGNAAA